MKRILKKRILPLLCVGLLLCTPHTIAYAVARGTESTIAQTEETVPCAEMPPVVETTPPVVEIAPPTEETIPPTEEVIPETTPTEEIAPPTETIPPTEEVIPETTPTEEIAPPTETIPPTEEVLSETIPTEGINPSTEAIPPIEEVLSETIPLEKPLTKENTQQTSYSVEIAWESLKFDCAPLWNPDKHCYDDWESTENPITVTNTSQNGAPIRVTLTFISMDKMGATAVFAPCEGDTNPNDFTFSDGQVTFLLPRDANSEEQATVNLFLTCGPAGRDTQQYNQIGSIKTEITPLNEGAQALETVPPVSDIQPAPESDLPLPKHEPLIVEKPKVKPTEPSKLPQAEPNQPEILPTEPSQPEILPTEPSQPEILPTEPSQPEILPTEPSQPETIPTEPSWLPPPTAEGNPPEIKAEKPAQDSTANAMPPPKQNLNEEANTAPHTESGAPPQEKIP